MSSQHPYTEQYIGKPHVRTVDFNNSQEFETAVVDILKDKVTVVFCYSSVICSVTVVVAWLYEEI